MTNDNEQPTDQAPAEEPATPPAVQPDETPPAVSEPQPVAAQPVAVEQRRWRPGRRVLAVAGAAAGAVLLFGSGFAVGHATGGDDHGGRRPMAMRDAGQRGPRDGNQQMPGQRQMPQGPNGQQQGPQRPNRQMQPDQQQQAPQQQGGSNQRQSQ